jgi:alpha-ketoglutarate-dependent taurine dioxygenase
MMREYGLRSSGLRFRARFAPGATVGHQDANPAPSDKPALALIDELMRHATQKKYEYRHKWRRGDWVLWDNRSVIGGRNAGLTAHSVLRPK